MMIKSCEEELRSLSAEVQQKVVAVKIDGKVIDLRSNVEGEKQWVLASSLEGLEVLRHSCAHLLADAVKSLYPNVKVGIGPVIENGFYYDFDCEIAFTPEHLEKIEERMREIAAQKIKIERHVWSRNQARQYFADAAEVFKVEVIESIPESEDITVYKQGDFLDLCRGPHVLDVSYLKAFKLMKCSGAYWKGDSSRPMLQRIYGTAWSTQEELDAYLHQLSERERRDHRKIGKQMDLFHTQHEAPGMIFWHANGWTVYNLLMDFMRQIYLYDYQEVKTPQLVSRDLWELSGHWQMFQHNMFTSESEKQLYAVKPMNCPCHVQIYNYELRSYKDLPLRFGEFGCCHRNEPSGTLSGLMRVRQFVQDDGHIFCAIDQISDEVKKFIKDAFNVYKIFGFEEIIVRLSTRPESRVGSESDWDKAENALSSILDELGMDWELQPGEGAFYGPKIEFSLKDCLDRVWQCGTVQIDFSMPSRLSAVYIDKDGQKQNVVIVHRAILGSLERFIGILVEHYAGNFPLWLTPVQCVVANISDESVEYCKEITAVLREHGMRVNLDLRNEKIGYKVREHVLKKIPYIIIIGKKEVEKREISVRYQSETKTYSLDEWLMFVLQACSIPKIQ